ncbi:MAG TPA: hypothetical protein VHZ53_01240, partial [Steroidobacteraceae bacterium]|nr:hypothetical protein [Steroidobacteraceae bacterium]
MKVTEIFTPSDYPTHTYVARSEDRLEERMREALATPGEIVSVSGPSKSGKTVLIEKVAGRDNLISVTGAGITSGSEVWDRALDWMDAPSQVGGSVTHALGGSVSGGAKGGVSIPLVASAQAEGSVGANASRTTQTTESRGRGGMAQVVREIGNSSYVLLVDDFHYMAPAIQADVAKQIKEAARQGVKIVTASVPHRSDDVVRSNPELRGRVRAVDTMPWKASELVEIGRLGFPKAGLEVTDVFLQELAVEASQSPQLMQAICLQLCFTAKHYDSTLFKRPLNLTQDEIKRAFEETSTRTDFASLIRSMHAGPKVRGTERKEFGLEDGSRGDVYRALLLALRRDPPTLSFSWNELSGRVQRVCSPDFPQAASLSTACAQIARIAREMFPGQRVL